MHTVIHSFSGYQSFYMFYAPADCSLIFQIESANSLRYGFASGVY